MRNSYMLQAALELAFFGLKVVPLHTVDPNGWCSCGCRKSNCGSRGKHPRLLGWQRLASSDEDVIGSWWLKWPMANVGVQWGPRSNAIDIEFDDEQGRATADRLMQGFMTPSYQSGRSIHRIFRYLDVLAGFGATKKGQKVEHLEFRIGADSKGAQSVAPPSRHHSGRTYCWLPGLSISDVEIAKPSAALVELILQSKAVPPQNGQGPQRAEPLAQSIPHGQRHTALVSLAGTMRRRGLVKEEMIPTLLAVLERRCEQVAGDEINVDAIAESVCQYEPRDPILAQSTRLIRTVRDYAVSHLSPAIQRARKHAIDHRLQRRRSSQ